MSILSQSKASLRGSQPVPDPAFSSQPHGSFPLGSAATNFWCLEVWGFFLPFLHCFSDQVGRMSRTERPMHRSKGTAMWDQGKGWEGCSSGSLSNWFWCQSRCSCSYCSTQVALKVFIPRARQGKQQSGCSWHCLEQWVGSRSPRAMLAEILAPGVSTVAWLQSIPGPLLNWGHSY